MLPPCGCQKLVTLRCVRVLPDETTETVSPHHPATGPSLPWPQAARSMLDGRYRQCGAGRGARGCSPAGRVRPAPMVLLELLGPYLIGGRINVGVVQARRLLGSSVAEAAWELGNACRVTIHDAVPFGVVDGGHLPA